jgi:hypothetical protein
MSQLTGYRASISRSIAEYGSENLIPRVKIHWSYQRRPQKKSQKRVLTPFPLQSSCEIHEYEVRKAR